MSGTTANSGQRVKTAQTAKPWPMHEKEKLTLPASFMFCNEEFFPTLSGGLYWAARKTLLVADLHLEKLASFAPSGQLLPPYDTALTLARLEADLMRTGATRLIALGDNFHRDEGPASLAPAERDRISRLAGRLDLIWLSGNHDPAPHALGGRCRPGWQEAGLHLTHEPDGGQKGLVCGHLHPAARLRVNGRSVRRPCFAFDGRMLMLPAYGVATGALNIKSRAFEGLFDWAGLRVFMLGRQRTYPVSPRHLVAG